MADVAKAKLTGEAFEKQRYEVHAALEQVQSLQSQLWEAESDLEAEVGTLFGVDRAQVEIDMIDDYSTYDVEAIIEKATIYGDEQLQTVIA